MNQANLSATYSDSKPHYLVLDGLRGVAALVVVWYHIFETFASSQYDQIVNHGYLAVDFFYILSGFVIGYAYDDRWGKMTTWSFLKRRVIRLHPMVVFSAVLGGSLFYLQGCGPWQVASVSLGSLLTAVLINALMIPATPTSEIRGYGEMYPLNGPTWSLFFEYIGNVLYAVVIRHLPTRLLGILVAVLAVALGSYAILGELGSLGAGWTLTPYQFLGGSLRLLFSFTAGLWISRTYRPIASYGAFWIGSILLIVIAVIPRIGTQETPWLNGIYDTIATVMIFPIIVYLGASSQANPKMASLYRWLGNISYPLYLVHFPFLYVYYAWVNNGSLTFIESLPGALSLFFGSILVAHLTLKLYDEPVRQFLTRLWMKR